MHGHLNVKFINFNDKENSQIKVDEVEVTVVPPPISAGTYHHPSTNTAYSSKQHR